LEGTKNYDKTVSRLVQGRLDLGNKPGDRAPGGHREYCFGLGCHIENYHVDDSCPHTQWNKRRFRMRQRYIRLTVLEDKP